MTTRREYEPPGDDEPLDAIQLALARCLARIVVKEIRREIAEAARTDQVTGD